jgi:hypothetical protein
VRTLKYKEDCRDLMEKGGLVNHEFSAEILGKKEARLLQ